MNLIIVESPGKKKTISSILGEGWTVEASMGHVRDLPEKKLGVNENDLSPEYVFNERGSEIIKKLKTLVAKADKVYLATDLDREGEAISWHLTESLGLKNYHRITFDAITPDVIKKALQSPRAIDMQRVGAQEARRVLDRLVGYKVSPVISDRTGKSGLSAGRVQSIAVRLMVERERAIRSFKATNHFGAALSFDGWTAEWITKDHLQPPADYILDESLAKLAASIRELTVSKFESSTKKQAPPAPFITSTLLQAASASLKMNPDRTMAAAQALYEGTNGHGHITYHRTDSPNFSDEALASIRAFAESKGLPLSPTPRKWRVKDGAQEAHEAIRPTHIEIEEAGDTEEQRALYKLIRERALACQLADAEYAVNKAELAGENGGKSFRFNAAGRVLVVKGWKVLTAKDAADEDGDESDNGTVPQLKEGSALSAVDGKVVAKKTQAPKRYTQASLVKKLEDIGVGRPSTYATITSTILRKAYIAFADDKQINLAATALGELVADSIVNNFAFAEYDFTRNLEDELDAIATGNATYKDVVGKAFNRLKQELTELSLNRVPPQYPCPDCGKALRQKTGTKGPFWGCSGYPECKSTLPDDKGKPSSRKPQALSEIACPKCQKPLIHRVKAGQGKSGYNFWGCSGFPACKAAFEDSNGNPNFNKAKK